MSVLQPSLMMQHQLFLMFFENSGQCGSRDQDLAEGIDRNITANPAGSFSR